jgi:alpha-ketoglutarate-dependent taurine dioxygenase
MIRSRSLTKYIGEMIEDKHLTEYTDDDINDLKKLLFYRKAVFFEDQNLTKQQLRDLGNKLKSAPDSQVYDQDLNSTEEYRYGETWHSDRDYKDALPLYTALQINILPENKLTGATEFADMVALHNFGISKSLQNMLKGMTAIHEHKVKEIELSPGIFGRRVYTATHPVVLETSHDDISVHSLFLNPAHVTKIIEFDLIESTAILKLIYEKLYLLTEFHYMHRWKEGSLVIWNNRLCNHRGLKDFRRDEIRLASRVVIY